MAPNEGLSSLARLLLYSVMDREISHQDRRRLTLRRAAVTLAWLLALTLALLALREFISPGVAREDLRIAPVERGTVVATISASGEVVPRHEQLVSARLASELLEVAVQTGDAVREGQLLLRLDAPAIEAGIRDLGEQLALKENERKSTRLELERSLNESRGRYELLEIDLEGARAKHERLASLVDRGAISRGDLQEAELEVRRREVELAQLERSIANRKATTEAELERIDLEASILRNQLEEQQRLLASAAVRSPRDGIVTWLLDEPGKAVASGAALARVADLSTFRVEIQVSDFYADRLREGLATRVDTGSTVLEGRLDSILPTVEGGTMTLLIELDNPSAPGLRPRLRVDAEIVIGHAEDALHIANGPAVGEGGSQYLYRLEGNQAVRTRVELGFASRDRVQVLAGLSEGDQVIISDMRSRQHLERIEID